MKLLQKTSRSYLLFSGVLLIVAGTFLYLEMTGFIDEETTEKLLIDKNRIAQQLEEGKPVAEFPPVIEIDTLTGPVRNSVDVKDTLLYDPLENEAELFRQVRSVESIRGQGYRITVRQVILEPGDYLSSIGVFIAAVFVVLLFGLYLINRRISSGTWKPFYATLKAMETFSVDNDAPIPLSPTSIREFDAFNRSVEKLIGQVRSDYETLKAFTADASHEIQTPLSIVQLRLEEALQVKDLPEESAQRILSALSASRRLSRLNQALLLLAKIEQQGQEKKKSLFPAPVLEQLIEQHREFIEARNLTVKKNVDPNVQVHVQPALLEILMGNLLSNAVKYSPENGTITVVLVKNGLKITNPGPPLNKRPEDLFQRFVKDNPSSSSPGLGLSIVKKICETLGWHISYAFENKMHILEVRF
jgi:hypothetical protein